MSTSIQIYILSRLMDENSYPYKLKKELSEPIPFDQLTNLTESKLYYHFESLTKQQLIEPVEVIKEENRPDKQVFAITEKGRIQLPTKIYSVFEKAESMTDMLIGLISIRFVDNQKIIALLEKKLAQFQFKIKRLESLRTHVQLEGTKKEVGDFLHGYYNKRYTNEAESLVILIEKLKNDKI